MELVLERMEPDWRLLGVPELLQLISEKLTSIADFVRFRAVCPAWRCGSSPRPRHLPPQLPWLLLRRDGHLGTKGSSLSAYDPSQSMTHTLHLPQIQGKYICGSSHGWLVLESKNENANDRGVWLFNPITSDQISLPPLSAQPKFLKGGGSVEDADSFCITKAILSSNPGLDPGCFVMALLSGSWETGFCRVGHDCWTILTVGDAPETPPDCGVADIIYHNHLFYTIYGNGEVWSWDIRKHFGKMVASGDDDREEFDYICTVEGTSGEHGLMIFCQDYSYKARPDPVYMSDIRMLIDQQQVWSNLEKPLTADHCFFVADDFHCISLPLANLKLHGWAENCICYTSQELVQSTDDPECYRCSIQLYKLDDGSITTLASNLGFIRRYKLAYHTKKNSWLLWLTPTLC